MSLAAMEMLHILWTSADIAVKTKDKMSFGQLGI